jgi:hypothetical protein
LTSGFGNRAQNCEFYICGAATFRGDATIFSAARESIKEDDLFLTLSSLPAGFSARFAP